jgi:hypothetical protein
MIVGLASTLPDALRSGLTGQGVPGPIADQVAGLPPVGSLFAAFLGYNPVRELLTPSGVLDQLPPERAATLTGNTFFPELISGPFQHGLTVVFTAALVLTLIGAAASALLPSVPRGRGLGTVVAERGPQRAMTVHGAGGCGRESAMRTTI